MRESKVEKYLREQIELRGGMCEKFVSPGKVGVPDRLVTWRAEMYLVETKATGGKLRPSQARDHKTRALHGIPVWVINSIEGVDAFIRELER